MAEINNLTKNFIEPIPRLEFKIVKVDEKEIGILYIYSGEQKPFLFKQDGTIIEGKNSKRIFGKGDIYVRRSGQSEKATYSEIRKIIEDELIRLRDKLFEGIKKVTSLPIEFLKNIIFVE